MIEGALLFAGSVARRLGTNTSYRAVFPFSVESVAVGYGSATASEETSDGSRAELWLPLWSEPVTFAEAKHLFAEGRAQLGRRQAKNAVEFALAVNLLGVSRGVKSFARYGFLKRNGLAFLAAPLGRVEVTLHPQARLLDDPPLTEWIDHLRSACRDKDKTPARYQTALRQVDRAMFEFANRSEQGNDAKYLLERAACPRPGRADPGERSRLLQGQVHPPAARAQPAVADRCHPGGRRRARVPPGCQPRVNHDRTEDRGRPAAYALGGSGTRRQVGEVVPRFDLSCVVESRTHPQPCGRFTSSLDGVRTGRREGMQPALLVRSRLWRMWSHFSTDRRTKPLLTDLLWALIGVKWTSADFRQRDFQKRRAEAFRSPHVTAGPAAFGVIRLTLTPLTFARSQAPHGAEYHWRIGPKEGRPH